MSSRPKLLRRDSEPPVEEIEIMRLRKQNAEQALVIEGLQKGLRLVQEEMKKMKEEHMKQLQFWTPVAHPFERTRRFAKPKLL